MMHFLVFGNNLMKIKLLIFVSIFFSFKSLAQDLGGLFRPGPTGHSISLGQQVYGDSKVQGSTKRLQQREWQARVLGTVWDNEKWEVTAGVDAQDLILHHPSTVLDTYRSFQGAVGVRRYSKKNQIRGMSLSYGSASDRPFAKSSNDTAGGNYLHQFNKKWWGLINWSNNRTFLNNVPLPGVFYVSKMTPKETLLFGFPAVLWRRRFESGFEVQYFGLLPYSHRAHAGWFWNRFHGVTLSYENRPRTFFRNDRVSKSERLFFVEQRAMLDVQGVFIPQILKWQIGVGTSFNRSVFEAKNIQQDKRFNLLLGDTWLASAELSSQF